MKKILTAIIALCAATAVTDAQENIRADYDFTSLQLRTDSMATTRFTLVSGPGRSLFFNTMSLYVDSLTSTPEGKKRLNEIQWAAWKVDQPDGSFKLDLTRQAPRKTVRMYVEKDFGNSELKLYNRFGEDDGYYTEPFDELKWEIQTDSTATVLGYECFMATTHYHGREWKGWFAPEIPVQDGPWKLQGLPGLILKAEADNGTVITATGIQATGEAVPPCIRLTPTQGWNAKKPSATKSTSATTSRALSPRKGSEFPTKTAARTRRLNSSASVTRSRPTTESGSYRRRVRRSRRAQARSRTESPRPVRATPGRQNTYPRQSFRKAR